LAIGSISEDFDPATESFEKCLSQAASCPMVAIEKDSKASAARFF
jgi:hypothetical protein